ncbi:MAG TPA: hypothetical protein VGJ95_22100 [Pseudonocardiaceae bacterium]|jgi:hypothetical protein
MTRQPTTLETMVTARIGAELHRLVPAVHAAARPHAARWPTAVGSSLPPPDRAAFLAALRELPG